MESDKHIDGIENQEERFKVPENYFSALEKDVMQVIADDEISIPAARLEVPEGYFDLMPEKVIKRIRSEKRTKLIRLSNWISAAASVVLIVSLFYLIPEKECETFTCMLEKTEIETEDLMFIDEEIIAEYYLELTSENITTTSEEIADTSQMIITDQLEEELLESFEEEDFYEEFDF